MDVEAARRVLGVGAAVDGDGLRRAYRSRLLATHPDLGGGPGDVEAVVAAYRVLVDAPAEAPPPPPSSVVVDGDTVAAELPAGDLFVLLCEVGEAIGTVTYADPDAGLLEVQVRLAGYGPCSVVLTLQGRATGVTEAWCTVETLAGGPPPAASEVAELLAAGLRTIT